MLQNSDGDVEEFFINPTSPQLKGTRKESNMCPRVRGGLCNIIRFSILGIE